MRKFLLFCVSLLTLASVFALISGCSEKSTWPTPSVVLESIPTTQPPRVDGVALDKEWYSAPELLVALSDENGNGGGSYYLRIKSVYTAYPDTVYFMLQWVDTTDDVLPDRLVYIGPAWKAMNCAEDPTLISPESWTKYDWEIGKEDKVCLLFEIAPVGDDMGTFASRGCLAACHGGMHPPSGKFDAWYWMRGRSDPVFRCDDMVLDSLGFRGDSGEGIWVPNRRDASFVPRYIARDPNGGLSPAKFIYDPGPFGRPLNQCDTINPATLLNWNDERDPAVDYVPGYVVKLPTLSRADIITRSNWDEGRWTIEIKRVMRTDYPDEDVAFYPDRTYNFAVAVMNGSKVIHSGSASFVLRFRR